MATFARNDARGELRPLQNILVTRFGDRQLKLPVEPVFQALDDLPLFFQGSAAGKVQLPYYEANHHGLVAVTAPPRTVCARLPRRGNTR